MSDNEALKKREELKEAAQPLHEWLCKNGHPHMVIIVQQDGVEAYEGVCATPLPVPD